MARLLLDAGREVEAHTQGGSMAGSIPPGSMIRICAADPDSLRAPHVIAFALRDTLVTHRLVARGRGRRARSWLIARGDAARLCDAPVPVIAVLGVVTAYQDAGQWRDIPGPPCRRGWNGLTVTLLEFGVRQALELDVRLAGAFVRLARRAGRAGGWLLRRIRGRGYAPAGLPAR